MFTPKVLSQYWSDQFSSIDCLLRAWLYQGQSILTETANCVLHSAHTITIAQHMYYCTTIVFTGRLKCKNYITLYWTGPHCNVMASQIVLYICDALFHIALNSLLASVFGCFTGALHCTVMASSTSTRTDRWHCFQLNVTRRGWALSRNCTGLDSKKGGKEEQNYMSWLKQEVKLEVGNFG